MCQSSHGEGVKYLRYNHCYINYSRCVFTHDTLLTRKTKMPFSKFVLFTSIAKSHQEEHWMSLTPLLALIPPKAQQNIYWCVYMLRGTYTLCNIMFYLYNEHVVIEAVSCLRSIYACLRLPGSLITYTQLVGFLSFRHVLNDLIY